MIHFCLKWINLPSRANTVNLVMALLVNEQKVDILLKQGAFTEITGGLSREVVGTDNIGIEAIVNIDGDGEPLLMQNYPNPFNPETWIPYQLSKPADVTIFIYNVDGRIVKRLKLGYMMPGYYIDRSRAAYWDGKNEAGEEVASGIYFYIIDAGDYRHIKRWFLPEMNGATLSRIVAKMPEKWGNNVALVWDNAGAHKSAAKH
ncbi:T9SS type A sorting domain-containing protein, partial [Candidatus Poribacteria bacterium]|nr:T9SS type A sorting domain-containing protein [Candidatus Poribacteria bacterium]